MSHLLMNHLGIANTIQTTYPLFLNNVFLLWASHIKNGSQNKKGEATIVLDMRIASFSKCTSPTKYSQSKPSNAIQPSGKRGKLPIGPSKLSKSSTETNMLQQQTMSGLPCDMMSKIYSWSENPCFGVEKLCNEQVKMCLEWPVYVKTTQDLIDWRTHSDILSWRFEGWNSFNGSQNRICMYFL